MSAPVDVEHIRSWVERVAKDRSVYAPGALVWAVRHLETLLGEVERLRAEVARLQGLADAKASQESQP